jgi:cellulose biosynthesis protein BcsQ
LAGAPPPGRTRPVFLVFCGQKGVAGKTTAAIAVAAELK